MIPTEEQAKALWEKYHLPPQKRVHVALVAKVATFFAKRINQLNQSDQLSINVELLNVAALLHDIDKVIPKLPGERHPDTAVRVLKEEGMDEVADIVKTHSLHSILNPSISPKTWEEKLLYLADKMVKYEIITVDKRFALWRAEHLPPQAIDELDLCYPKVKHLEKEVFDLIGMKPEEVKSAAILA